MSGNKNYIPISKNDDTATASHSIGKKDTNSMCLEGTVDSNKIVKDSVSNHLIVEDSRKDQDMGTVSKEDFTASAPEKDMLSIPEGAHTFIGKFFIFYLPHIIMFVSFLFNRL